MTALTDARARPPTTEDRRPGQHPGQRRAVHEPLAGGRVVQEQREILGVGHGGVSSTSVSTSTLRVLASLRVDLPRS